MLYINGLESEKIKSEEIISKVVTMVEKKAAEIENHSCERARPTKISLVGAVSIYFLLKLVRLTASNRLST